MTNWTLTCARLCSVYFMCVNSLNPLNIPMQNVLLFSDKRVKATNEKLDNLLGTIFLRCSHVAQQSRDASGFSEFAPAKSKKFPGRQGQCLIPWEPIWNPAMHLPHPTPKIMLYSILLFLEGGRVPSPITPRGFPQHSFYYTYSILRQILVNTIFIF